MGYDCYVVDSEGESVGHFDDPGLYLRRNIFGMGPLRDRLLELGMGYWPQGKRGEYPDPPKAVDYDENGESIGAEGKAYRAAILQFLKETCDERPGICLEKLTSNDGWWVTKVECQSALRIWELAGEPQVDEYGDVIPFLRAGAAYSGFRVY